MQIVDRTIDTPLFQLNNILGTMFDHYTIFSAQVVGRHPLLFFFPHNFKKESPLVFLKRSFVLKTLDLLSRTPQPPKVRVPEIFDVLRGLFSVDRKRE